MKSRTNAHDLNISYTSNRARLIVRFSRAMSRADAEDPADETICIAVRDWQRFNPALGNEQQWISGIAKNAAANRTRRHTREAAALARLAGYDAPAAAEDDDIANRLDAAVALLLAVAAIRLLPRQDHHLVTTAMTASLTYAAAHLSSTEQVQLHRVRHRLQRKDTTASGYADE